jgi:hypothetical protein
MKHRHHNTKRRRILGSQLDAIRAYDSWNTTESRKMRCINTRKSKDNMNINRKKENFRSTDKRRM